MSEPAPALPRYILIGFDGEWTGPDPLKHFMPSLGMACYDAETEEQLDKLLVLFQQPEDRGWDEKCRNEFWLKQKHLYPELHRLEEGLTGYSIQKGMNKVMKWLNSMKNTYTDNDPRRITFVTNTALADPKWFGYYLHRAGLPSLDVFWGGRFKDAIQTSSYALGAAGLDAVDYCKGENGHLSEDKALRKALNIPEDEQPKVPGDHNPMNDACHIVEEHLIHVKYIKKRKLESYLA